MKLSQGIATPKLEILIIGIGFPIPTFIANRINSLDEVNVGITIACSRMHRSTKLNDRIKYIDLIESGGYFSLKAFRILLSMVLNMNRCRKLWICSTQRSLKGRIAFMLKHWPLTMRGQFNLIHLQWITMGREYKYLRNFHSCPVIASARGSQVTVYPYTDHNQKKYLLESFQNVDFIHCVSQSIANHCLKLGAVTERLFVNYNGVDLSKFNSTERVEGSDTFQMVTIGALIWRKGYVYQLLMLKSLLKRHANIILTIIGEGNERNALMYMAFILGVREHVKFAGSLDHTEVSRILTNSDVYISTSAAEGLANSVMEACATGLPTVCFECEGMREVIDEGKSGFIVPFGDVEGLVYWVEYLIINPNLRKIIGDDSRRKMIKDFDDKMHVKKMVQWYNQIVMENVS